MRDFGLGRCRKPGQQKFATWLPVTFQFVGIWFSVRRALILSSAVYDSQFAVFWFSVRRNPILRWGAAFSTKIRLEIRFTTWPPSGSSAGWLQFQAKCEAQPSDGREIFEKNEKKFGRTYRENRKLPFLPPKTFFQALKPCGIDSARSALQIPQGFSAWRHHNLELWFFRNKYSFQEFYVRAQIFSFAHILKI